MRKIGVDHNTTPGQCKKKSYKFQTNRKQTPIQTFKLLSQISEIITQKTNVWVSPTVTQHLRNRSQWASVPTPKTRLYPIQCQKWCRSWTEIVEFFLNIWCEMGHWQIKHIQCWWDHMDNVKKYYTYRNRNNRLANRPIPLTHVSKTW